MLDDDLQISSTTFWLEEEFSFIVESGDEKDEWNGTIFVTPKYKCVFCNSSGLFGKRILIAQSAKEVFFYVMGSCSPETAVSRCRVSY